MARAPAPDLVVDTPTVSVDAPSAGERFTPRCATRATATQDSRRYAYYQSTDASITAGDAPVGTDSVSPLESSERGDESVGLTAPSTPGTYYFGACVDAVTDESDTNNNCSSAVTVTVGAASSVPGAPTGLSATADGQTEIDLSWGAPSNDGGASITGYKIEVSANGSSWSNQVADTGSASTTYSHAGLSAGSTRHYRVSAINSEGTGPASSTDSATTESRANAAPTAVGTVPDQVIILGD